MDARVTPAHDGGEQRSNSSGIRYSYLFVRVYISTSATGDRQREVSERIFAPAAGGDFLEQKIFSDGARAALHCCPCFGLDGFERIAPQGSAGAFLSGIFPIADLYASSMVFCFCFSSGVIWWSGDKLILGVGI
jgi:hypothetical protein